MDEELRGLAFTTLQALMVDFPEWREDVLSGFAYFIVREVTDVHPTLLDNAVKMLLQLISQWRQAVQSSNKSHDAQVGQGSLCCINFITSDFCMLYALVSFVLMAYDLFRCLILIKSSLHRAQAAVTLCPWNVLLC